MPPPRTAQLAATIVHLVTGGILLDVMRRFLLGGVIPSVFASAGRAREVRQG